MNCEAFQARLISGEKPSEDASLSAHVGSCLRCFRTAADMRDVPRLASLLRDANEGETAYDPGARFWEKFPLEVAAAWVSSRPSRNRTASGWWEQASLWLRRPVPAALTGALCAVGLALLVMRPAGGPDRGSPALSAGAEAGLAGELGAAEVGTEMGTVTATVTGGEAGDESVGELDLEALASLRDDLNRALGPSDEAVTLAEASDEGASPSDSASDPTILAEDLDMLDETGLLALREKLGPTL